MTRIAQLGIAVGALGAMITIMGLFPGVTGLPPTAGIGLVQIFTVLIGYTLLIWGALIYVKFTFYSFSHSNLAQQIGTRFALTGLVLAAMTALADVLGFGSHGLISDSTVFLGQLQALGIVLNFLLSAIGVMIYAISGNPDQNGR
ncbi:MAG: hypothetical protein RLP44_00155 [Aggregatilineales bacterium]